MALLKLENLYKYYTGAQSVVVGLNGIDLSFEAGEFVAITGESGSGKSTLAHVLGGILPYENGEMLLEGRPTSHYDGNDWERYRLEQISFISQSYGILPGASVLSNVVSALRLTGMRRREAHKQAEVILKKVDLWSLRKRRAARLSSGQKQRLSIARALAKPSPILLADEPTGNLDAENSAKVIELLAQVAKERLVILITHEFSEAEDYVTRHITLQDGKVTSDVALRPVSTEVCVPQRAEKKKPHLSGYIAALQLRSRPVWCLTMLALFALTAFAVFAFLGTFLSSLDDTSTRIYDNAAFRNGDTKRIVVVREDGEEMTREDMDTLLKLDYVVCGEQYGYVRDFYCAWRKDVDYRIDYALENIGNQIDFIWQQTSSVTFLNTEVFVQTVPVFADDSEQFLTAGRLPEHIWEVVAVGDKSLIGQKFSAYIQDRKNWGPSDYIYLELTVVGVTDFGSGLYFHEDMGRVLTLDLLYENVPLYLPADLADNEVLMSKDIWDFYYAGCDPETIDWSLSVERLNFTVQGTLDEEVLFKLNLAGYTLTSMKRFSEVSEANFDLLMPDTYGDQISLTIEDYAYCDRVLEEIRQAGYFGMSPFRESSNEQDGELAKQRIQTLLICLIALLAVLLLQIVVLRAMFSVQTESYRLLSNIGLRCKTAKGSAFLQILLFTLLGEAASFGLLSYCVERGVERIVAIQRYLTSGYSLILFGVHLAACLVTAFWVMRSIRKQVYPYAAVQPDLKEVAE